MIRSLIEKLFNVKILSNDLFDEVSERIDYVNVEVKQATDLASYWKMKYNELKEIQYRELKATNKKLLDELGETIDHAEKNDTLGKNSFADVDVIGGNPIGSKND